MELAAHLSSSGTYESEPMRSRDTHRSIEVATTVRAGSGRVVELLLTDPTSALSETCSAGEKQTGTFPMGLSIALGAGASLHQEVTAHVDVGHRIKNGLVLPLDWHATGRESMLPTFMGELEVSPFHTGTSLRLRGRYTTQPWVVWLGDVGRRLVHRSLHDLVEQLARRLESEAERRGQVPECTPARLSRDARISAGRGLPRLITAVKDRHRSTSMGVDPRQCEFRRIVAR